VLDKDYLDGSLKLKPPIMDNDDNDDSVEVDTNDIKVVITNETILP